MFNQATTLPYTPINANAFIPYQGEDNIFVAMVQDESVVQMYPMRSGDTGIFFNFDKNKFWVKSLKSNGMPEPIRRYSFTQDKTEESMSGYVTTDDLKKFEERIMSAIKGVKKDESV